MVKRVVAGSALVMVAFGLAWAGGDWSGAKGKVDDFKSKQDSYRRLTKSETAEIVAAICAADEEERKSVGERARDRAQQLVKDEASDLEYRRDGAYKAIDEVLAEEALKENHSDAKSLRDDVKARWESFLKMKERLRGGNHPVVRFMLEQGQKAHLDRQEDECDAMELTLDSGRADCLMARGEVCEVIELKPDNSSAIGKGDGQARRYTAELNAELESIASKKATSSKVLDKLNSMNSKFKDCKKFEYRVDCYKLCPAIDDNGESSEPRVDWRKNC